MYIINIEWYKSYDIVPLVQRFLQATYKHTHGVTAVTRWQILLRVELRALDISEQENECCLLGQLSICRRCWWS